MSIRSGRSVQRASDTPAFSFSINGQALPFVDSHKHLGVILTADLEWKVHAREVISKGTKKAGLLKWMARELPSSVAIKLYLCYVRPSLEYAAPVWHGSILENDATKLSVFNALWRDLLKRLSGKRPKKHCSRALTGLLCAGAVKSTPCYCFLTY